jgi:hypothetical protein
LYFPESEDTIRARICVSMAGYLAEEKSLGLQWPFEEDVITSLRAVRTGPNHGLRQFPSDPLRIALALFDDDPPIKFSEARRAIGYWREETKKLLDEPRVWCAVGRIAKALLSRSRGYLSPREVRKLLGDDFFPGSQTDDDGTTGRADTSAPRIMRFGHVARISLEEERVWRKAREDEAASAEAKLEQARHVEHLSHLGTVAAQSPTHSPKKRRKPANPG